MARRRPVTEWWGNSTAGWSSTMTYPSCPHGNNRAFCYQCSNPGIYSPSSPFYHPSGAPAYQLGGWKCPGCGRCYNPAVTQCLPCAPVADMDSDCVPVAEGGLCDHEDAGGTCLG